MVTEALLTSDSQQTHFVLFDLTVLSSRKSELNKSHCELDSLYNYHRELTTTTRVLNNKNVRICIGFYREFDEIFKIINKKPLKCLCLIT